MPGSIFKVIVEAVLAIGSGELSWVVLGAALRLVLDATAGVECKVPEVCCYQPWPPSLNSAKNLFNNEIAINHM
jgi:hypothetical protein